MMTKRMLDFPVARLLRCTPISVRQNITSPKGGAPFLFLLTHLARPISAVALAVIAAPAMAAEPPAKIDVSQLPAQARLVDDVVVPVASEVFGVLDKLGSPNWHSVLRPAPTMIPAAQGRTSLLLGAVIAEGFIAVEAQDSEEVKRIGKTVLKLSTAIGVQESVKRRSNSIIEAADKKDWPLVRRELDGAQADVKAAMSELQSDQLAQLVSLGGWLRGTEALTTLVTKTYTADTAELLHQPALLDYFQRRIAAMDGRLKSDELITRIHQRLGEIRPLIETPDGQIPQKSVEQIHGITRELVKALSSKDS
jgi:hypothetical protein